jgi:hypothetical protein
MAKWAYKPIGLLMGVLGSLVAGKVFDTVWKAVAAEEEAPQATERHRGWSEVLLAAAVNGAIFGLVKAAFDRLGARSFSGLTGTWPDDE